MTRRLAIAVSALLGAACSSFEEVRLPTFDAALALAPHAAAPAFFPVSQLPRDLPLAVPYAQLTGDFPPNYRRADQSAQLVGECFDRDFRPDFIVFHPGGIASPGNALQVSPTFAQGGLYGLTFSSAPVIRGQAVAICYRLATFSLGFLADGNWMVTHVNETARSSGIQEGDSVQTIGGAELRPRMPRDLPPWSLAVLTKKPRDTIELTWIRPGTGRMRGTLVLDAPQKMPPDAKPWHWSRADSY